ncbi:MAG: hypothetical protein ACLQDQ_05505 [Myxococcaceae bacterium]
MSTAKDRKDRFCDPCRWRRKLNRWVDKYGSLSDEELEPRSQELLAQYSDLAESDEDEVHCTWTIGDDDGPLCATRMADLLDSVCIDESNQDQYVRACKAFKQQPIAKDGQAHYSAKREAGLA